MTDNTTTDKLTLADIVRLWSHDSGSFADAIVTKITGDTVSFARPYMTHPGFETTGGIIPLIGLETFDRPRSKTEPILRIGKGTAR